MPSLLDFTTSEGFRRRLLTRNLTPYAKAPNRPSLPIDTVYVQSDSSVQDSPDQLIDEPSLANRLYPLNQWGAEGGYRQAPDPTGLLNTRSNEGEYGPGQQDARILEQAGPESLRWRTVNAYANGGEALLDSGEYITEPDFIFGTRLYNNQPYPTTFLSSSYPPVGILLSRDPQGSNGFLSQDSFIARLGAERLRQSFQQTIADNIRQNTLGRANILNVDSGNDVLNLITGRVPLLEPNWTITVPSNPILAAADFALRLAGSIIPVSPIPGSYFDQSISLRQPTTIQQLQNAFRRSAVGNFFNRLLGAPQTGSQLFFNNTGGGQKSRLFANIDFNKFKPNYERSFLGRVAGALVGGLSDNSNYYVGSRTSEPSQVFSPAGALPVNEFGVVQQSPVFGPTELAQLYEGPSREVRLGANGPTYSNGGGIEGGFTWVSPKYRGNAGKRVGLGGEVTREDEDFRPSSYNSTESTERTFREGSILDDTQRLINSQPQGGKRLQHVGNAIDQVSKVFNDGYVEMTKGSRVFRFEDSAGNAIGTEYCRVFTKDTPYLQYNDLQKVDGITTQGRRFSYSVFDNTYNLNIVPNKQEGGQDSSNLIGSTNTAYAKKYMFSLENLAWRTSSTPGASTSDLAICERGPNGGRVMWFPPYGLKFNESVQASWNQSEFLGRPEPIYTYKSTNRGGTLSWKIVVDHPSVLNVIVDKILANETNSTRINSILDSFFAGCQKYDIYELAKEYATINPNDLFQLQEAISSKKLTSEEITYAKEEIQTGVAFGQGEIVKQANPSADSLNTNFQNLGFYFANDFPKANVAVTPYNSQYNIYIAQKPNYGKQPNGPQLTAFFDSVVQPNFKESDKLIDELAKTLTEYNQGTISITISSSCSAPATISYNNELSKRRVESVVQYLSSHPKLSTFYNEKRFLILTGTTDGERTPSQPLTFNEKGEKKLGATVTCTDNDRTSGGDTQKSEKEFSTNAMACRRAFISKIEDKTSKNVPETIETPLYTDVLLSNTATTTTEVQEVTRNWRRRDNITKRVLRAFLSECDYFQAIKTDTPMVFDNLRDKLKYFNPAFHSMTPEGLNTRLTFLQQCMRPGDTIPTIKEVNGAPILQYNNAVNTAFGAPPVLILRIGDFYNTKIIPESLQLTYEDLDINPEGIGVQPMICDVTMNFKFVGGSGLKEAVDKLQNALTFNYYANTEIYDDRADNTEDNQFLRTLDNFFLAKAVEPKPPGTNQSQGNNGQNNNQPIGSIQTRTTFDFGESGTTSYSDFMVNFVNVSQTYFQNVVNKQIQVTSQYNNAVRQQWMLERKYTQGETSVDTSNSLYLFGKPDTFEARFDAIFADMQTDITNNNDEFIKFISDVSNNLNDRTKEVIKTNYSNVVKNKRGIFQNAITTTTQDFVNIETQYIQNWSRANIITYNSNTNESFDGFQEKNGNVVLYRTSGLTQVDTSSSASNTLAELADDVKKVQNDIKKFNELTFKKNSFQYAADSKTYDGYLVFETQGTRAVNWIETKQVFEPFSKKNEFTNPAFRRQYMILSDDVLDDKKYETFKNSIIGNILNNTTILGNTSPNLEQIFDRYWISRAKPLFSEENNITKAFIDSVSKNELKDFLVYTPFPKKNRILSFTTEGVNDTPITKKRQESMITSLAAQTNQNSNPRTWNDNVDQALISKAKLN